MNASEEFYQFAEELTVSLQKVPFQDLDTYEGKVISWQRGSRKGAVSIKVEIVSRGYKRVTIEGGLPGRVFNAWSLPFKKQFRAYQSGVRVTEVQ